MAILATEKRRFLLRKNDDFCNTNLCQIDTYNLHQMGVINLCQIGIINLRQIGV